jgi:hypothetical protein
MFTGSRLVGGCYLLQLRTERGCPDLLGTLRVERSAARSTNELVISGDLYASRDVLAWSNPSEPRSAGLIPIFPRSAYHSYLDVLSASLEHGRLQLVADQRLYRSRGGGTQGHFFLPSGSRMLTLDLFARVKAGKPIYEGRASVGHQDVGSVTLGWTSSNLRRAGLSIHSLEGAVPPEPVFDGALRVYFDTVFADVAWDLSVHEGAANIRCRPGLAANGRWTNSDLFELLQSVRTPSADLDKEWSVDLLVVPYGRDTELGVLFDEEERTAAATFCDGRYSNVNAYGYGEAVGKRQRDIPRAYLRSALHEVTHVFNQIDQHRGRGDDNSIMTTSPRLANLLTLSGETFPAGAKMTHSAEVGHLLKHLPDPVVRPGGWPFQSWCQSDVPGRARRVCRLRTT